MNKNKRIAVIGGGAAGFFYAINKSYQDKDCSVSIFEAGGKFLSKVAISGGGRCNVTNYTLENRELVRRYPRGSRELLGAFERFSVRDVIEWFRERGVLLRAESDGRMFPESNCSSAVVDLFLSEARRLEVSLRLRLKVRSIKWISSRNIFLIGTERGEEEFDIVLIASGGGGSGFDLVRGLGHTIVPPVPSLFTFECRDSLIDGLQGVSFENVVVSIRVGGRRYVNSGPLLFTHWGLSGPVVIVLSSVCARELYDLNYQVDLRVNFLGGVRMEEAVGIVSGVREDNLNKRVVNLKPFNIPSSFWVRVLELLGLSGRTYQELGRKDVNRIVGVLTDTVFRVSGKGVFKEEFVTAGGVDLREVDFRTMQSKLISNLYFAGEVLNIDGVTGGYNFQSAWTTAFIASSSEPVSNQV